MTARERERERKRGSTHNMRAHMRAHITTHTHILKQAHESAHMRKWYERAHMRERNYETAHMRAYCHICTSQSTMCCACHTICTWRSQSAVSATKSALRGSRVLFMQRICPWRSPKKVLGFSQRKQTRSRFRQL